MRKDIKASCQKRLSRIEGQVRGLSKMVDEDRYCIDIVTQITAVRAALRRVEEEVLRDHVSHCVEHAITSGDKADQRSKIAELMAVISRADRGAATNPVWKAFTPQNLSTSLFLRPIQTCFTLIDNHRLGAMRAWNTQRQAM